MSIRVAAANGRLHLVYEDGTALCGEGTVDSRPEVGIPCRGCFTVHDLYLEML